MISTGGTTTLGLYDTQSQLKLKADITYVDNKVDPLVGGHKGFATLAQAQASQSGLVANTVVEVLSDTTEANNGYYLWNGTTLTKSAYDPLTKAKGYTDNKLDFVSNLPENNQFIKELYITGWNGTDEIYLQYFNGNDNGKVTFIFKNKTANRDVVYTHQKAQGFQIYPLETAGAATGSGFGGYIVVDWNAYTTAINAQGAYTYTYKVTKKALNLVNCPFIKEYLDTNSINASISVHTADISVLKEVNAKSSTLSSTATHAQAANLNNFIKSIKLKDGHTSGFSYFIDSIVQTATTAIINIKYYNPENPSQANPWAVNNITLTKGVSAVETYEVRKEGYRWLITLDWKYKPSANVTGGTLSSLPLNLNKLFEEDIVDLQLSQPSFYKVRNDIKDGQSKLASFLSGATFTANGDTAYTQTVTKVEDGARIVLTNTNANVNRRFLYRMIPFYVRIPDTYFIYVKFTINAVSTEANSFVSYISHSGKNSSAASFFDNVRAGQTYEEVRKITGDATGARSTEGSLFLEFWSAATSPAGVQLDITIHDIRLLANYDQDPVFLNKERKEIEQLVRAVGYFESEIVIPKFVDTALQQQNINKGLEMQSLGDSTSVMVMWQERLAQMKGWRFNRTMAISGLNGKYPLALGGSWCEPIVSNFGAVGASGQNHYTRSSSIADYGIDVLFVLSSFNGQHIGKAWQTGGQLVKSDHGINDEPYHGGEVNLITTPTADFPSFGASYYGMLEKIMTANPNTRIVLLTLYLFNVTGNDLANILAKNAVIRKAAEKYSLQLIDLEKISGINSFTASTLSFEGGVHINQKGGDRLAQVIGGIV